jgi:hypothetical protein
MLNAVLVLMLTTAILGPVLTDVFAPRLLAEDASGGGNGGRVSADIPLSNSPTAAP